MKKILCVTFLLMISFLRVDANEGVSNSPDLRSDIIKMKMQREAAFEKRLGLTDAQKAKARELRINSHEKMKPIMEQIFAKKQELKMVKMSRMAVQMQEEKITLIEAELKVLEKKAKEIRKLNMKQFESILTREQRKILKQMKKEGRKRYQEQHPSKGMKFIK